MALDMAADSYIPIYGEFCKELEEIVVECIELAKRKGKKTVTLLINSNGGSDDSFTSIKGAMEHSKLEFTGFVTARARSNGFRLLQHCHTRVAVRNATLLFHWGYHKLINSDIAALMDGENGPIDYLVNTRKVIAQEVHQRTGVPIKDLYKYALYERQFLAEDARNMNFIDEIVEDVPDRVQKAEKEKRRNKK